MIGFKINLLKFSKTLLHQTFFYLLILFLPTQFGLHFWPSWSLVNGQRLDYLSPTIYFTDVLIFLTLFFWLIPNLTNLSNWSNSIKKLVIPVALVILFILFSIFYLNPFVHLFKLLKILELYLLFLYIKNNVTMIIICGLLFESFLSLFQFINQHSINGLFYFFGERSFSSSTPGIAQAIINGQLILRPYGTFSHPNSLAGYFLASLFLIVYLFSYRHSGLSRILSSSVIPAKAGIYKIFNSFYILLLTIIFSLLTIFLSFSRSAWLVATILFFIIGLLNIKKLLFIIKKNFVLSFALGFALCTLTFALFKPAYYRISSIITTDSQTLQKRADLNQLAIKMFLSSPLIGVGLNNFIPNISRFTQNQPQIRLYQPVHNIYLLILAESGLLGFFLFLFLIYKTLKMSLRGGLSSTFYLLSSLIVILLTGLFDHYWFTLQQNQLLLTLVLGLIYSQKIKNKIPIK